MSRTPQLPATHGPTLHLSPPSWSGLASQLKSLLVGSPLLTASLVVVGVGSAAIAYASSERARRRQRERRRVLRLVRARFDECRLDILKFIFEQEWNRFTVAQLDQLYGAFSSLLSNRHRGVLPLTSLAGIIRAAGVSDDRVGIACAKFFDPNGDCQVDFLELVERLNLAVFGSRAKKLAAYFSVFDLDRSGRVSADEVKEVLMALGHARPNEAVNALFLKADKVRAVRRGSAALCDCRWSRFVIHLPLSVRCLSVCQNHDGHIDLQEFIGLADSESLSFDFTNNVAQHFGLEQIE